MRIIFAGTPEFAVPCLQVLIRGQHELVAVYTQPDRPAGRGRKLTASPVKQCALENEVPVYQPLSLKDEAAKDELRALTPDLMVVVAYGLILPPDVLDIPTHGCWNIHASLLPRWRGAAPIQRAIQAGDSESGITLMQMDAGLDTGDMLMTARCPITDTETAGSLHDRLASLGAEVLDRGLNALALESLQPTPQPETGVTYAHKLDKSEARIDWNLEAKKLAALIRAFNPWPVAHTALGRDPLRLWRAQPIESTGSHTEPGMIIRATAEGIDVSCGNGCLRILELQWPGGKRLSAAQAINGRDLVGQRFG